MHLVVKTQATKAVREVNTKKDCNVRNIDSSFMPKLNQAVMKLVEDAVERAHSNNRKTLMGKDV